MLYLTGRRFESDDVFDERQMNFDIGENFSFDDSHVRLLDRHHLRLAVRQEEVGAGFVAVRSSSVTNKFLRNENKC